MQAPSLVEGVLERFVRMASQVSSIAYTTMHLRPFKYSGPLVCAHGRNMATLFCQQSLLSPTRPQYATLAIAIVQLKS